MRYNLATILLIGAAGLTLAACEKKVTDRQADAVRDTSEAAAANMEKSADALENRGEAMGEAAEDNAEATADAMRNKADVVEERGEARADAIEDGTVSSTTAPVTR